MDDKDIYSARARIFARITQAEQDSQSSLSGLTRIYESSERYRKQYKENKNRIAEVNNKLSDTASRDDEIQILKNKLDDIEKNITEILKTIGQLEQNISRSKGSIKIWEDEASKMKDKIGGNESINLYLKYAEETLIDLESELKDTTNQAIKVITSEMNLIFKQTAGIDVKVKIMEDFSIDYTISGQRREASEGYQVYIGIIFVLSLISFNKIRRRSPHVLPGVIAPLVLDAPTAKLGEKLMNGLFEILKNPKHSDQVVLLLNTKETLGSSLKDILGANISKEYLMTYHEKSTSEENINKDKEIIINGKKHQWYFNNETINTTKIKKIV